MMDVIGHFHFLRPEWFWLVPAIIGIEFLARHQRRDADPFSGTIDAELLKHLRIRHKRRWGFTPSIAFALLIGLAITLLAGPSWRQQPSPLNRDAAPLIMLLDISDSMNNTDVAPSRLERARQKMTDLLTLIRDKQVAIIVFAGSAHTVLPLTPDHDIVGNYLASLSSNLAPRPGKFPEYALTSINRVLAGVASRSTVLLVTDGLGADSQPLIRAWCAEDRQRLIIYGIGSESAEQSDAPLQRAVLEDLADQCNGDYVDDTVDRRDVEAIAGKLIDRYQVIDDSALPWLDSGYWLVFPCLMLTALWFRRGWSRLWMWWLVLLCLAEPEPAVAQAAHDPGLVQAPILKPQEQSPSVLHLMGDSFVELWLSPDQYGYVLLRLGYPKHAAKVFDNPLWQATALYYAENFEAAADRFTRKDSDAALFNEANAHAQRRDYTSALSRYDRLLKRNPDFPGARENRVWVQRLVDEINRLSESQPDEAGIGSEDMDESDPRMADGAEDLNVEEQERPQYSAEDILASPETAQLWLRSVQQDPADFLKLKFGIQLKERGVSEP